MAIKKYRAISRLYLSDKEKYVEAGELITLPDEKAKILFPLGVIEPVDNHAVSKEA